MPVHPPPSIHRAACSRVSTWLCGWPLLLSLLFCLLGLTGAAQAAPMSLSKQGIQHLGSGG
ncbi:hypothetical protein, partial [Janthinobacterium sp. UMAB-56]|uniref:hypothetical protein n=1 Tax=Janthinobacterium sp. UMAB-56 TaxID=1365361 RepID=UPI00214B05F2